MNESMNARITSDEKADHRLANLGYFYLSFIDRLKIVAMSLSHTDDTESKLKKEILREIGEQVKALSVVRSRLLNPPQKMEIVPDSEEEVVRNSNDIRVPFEEDK